jgi:hypothetical protein
VPVAVGVGPAVREGDGDENCSVGYRRGRNKYHFEETPFGRLSKGIIDELS